MTDRRTIAVYDSRAETYADLPISQIQADSLDAFLAELPAGAHILDLGCGPGVQAATMLARGFSVDAIDATPDMVRAARSRGVDARVGTFDDMPGRPTYHGIWASFSLLHAPRADLLPHLQAAARALLPGGTLFLGMKLGEGERRDDIGRFYAYFSEQELVDALIEAGLTPTRRQTGAERGLAGTIDPFILIHARG